MIHSWVKTLLTQTPSQKYANAFFTAGNTFSRADERFCVVESFIVFLFIFFGVFLMSGIVVLLLRTL